MSYSGLWNRKQKTKTVLIKKYDSVCRNRCPAYSWSNTFGSKHLLVRKSNSSAYNFKDEHYGVEWNGWINIIKVRLKRKYHNIIIFAPFSFCCWPHKLSKYWFTCLSLNWPVYCHQHTKRKRSQSTLLASCVLWDPGH